MLRTSQVTAVVVGLLLAGVAVAFVGSTLTAVGTLGSWLVVAVPVSGSISVTVVMTVVQMRRERRR